jgi:bifunctional DNase/RNase
VGTVVLLADDPDPEKARLLPIFIGGTEALSIQTRLEGKRFPRPLTHDLYDRSLAELGARVVEARVLRLEGTTFIGAIVLETHDGRVVEVDARPSDAIALAVGNDAPIHVAEPVLAAAGVTKEQLDRGTPTPGRGNPTML